MELACGNVDEVHRGLRVERGCGEIGRGGLLEHRQVFSGTEGRSIQVGMHLFAFLL
jgi:hypothetical protein